jgi:DnaJ-class molecular chaperone
MTLNELAETYFHLSLPVSSISLKKAYRKAALKLHPDAGGNDTEFKEMQAAYERLTKSENLSTVFSNETEYNGETVAATVDGIPLLGLGPTTNGSDCPRCSHKGYVEYKPLNTVKCDCDYGMTYRSAPCKHCRGTGTVKLAIGLKVVDCERCKGTGRFFFRGINNLIDCPKCEGIGWRSGETSSRKYRKCYECEGTGELPMMNPVLMKCAFGS